MAALLMGKSRIYVRGRNAQERKTSQIHIHLSSYFTHPPSNDRTNLSQAIDSHCFTHSPSPGLHFSVSHYSTSLGSHFNTQDTGNIGSSIITVPIYQTNGIISHNAVNSVFTTIRMSISCSLCTVH